MDTIFALASARGRAGVAVVRVSGSRAFAAGRELCGTIPQPGHTGLRIVRDGEEVLDRALVLSFKAGHSFTGEDVVELQLHGSRAVVASVLNALGRIDGLRLAEPGEFTRRALENGQLDLTQVEGLADLIEAETEAQRRQALRVFSGELGKRTTAWRAKLMRAAALLAAVIDFSDEELPEDVSDEALELLREVREDLQREINGARAAETIRDGFEVAIVGSPNVGKSTLLNALAGREAAITSEIAGTTRDVIEIRMNLNGLPVTLLDTAGLRDSDDVVESIGIDRAIQRATEADLRVFLRFSGEAVPELHQEGDIVLAGKDDNGVLAGVSGKTGAGVKALEERIARELEGRASGAGLAIRERHRAAMERAVQALTAAERSIEDEHELLELVAEEVRSAVLALDTLIGRVNVEDLLGEIFASFCLGK